MIMICMKCRAEADVNYHEKEKMAVCSLCGGMFEVNDYAKKMLIETKSIIKESRRKGFMFGCMNCSTEREVELKDGKATCKVCGSAINLPPAMLNALKEKVSWDDDGKAVSDRPSIRMGRKTPKDVVAVVEEVPPTPVETLPKRRGRKPKNKAE